MNLDEEAGQIEWLRPGRYVGFINSVKLTVTRNQKRCAEFLVRCPEGQQRFRLMLQGNCLWTWQRLASNVGIPKEEREDWPLEYDKTDLNKLKAGGMEEKAARKAARIVVTDEAKLGWFFVTKPVGITVIEKKGDTSTFTAVDDTFKPTDDEIAAAKLGMDDDEIPF